VSTQQKSRTERRREQRRQRRAPAQQSIWRGPLPIIGAVVLVIAAIGGFVLIQRSQRSGGAEDAAAVAAKVTSVRMATSDAVGAGTITNPLKPAGTTVLKGPSGKPVVIYVGAEYCPFCASERWSLIVALSRFGTFRDLSLTRSASSDVYPNTPTFSFRGSTYASDSVEFSAVETADREGKELDTPNALQQASLTKYDPSGSIPYVSIADRFVGFGSGYPPDVLAGKTWSQIADALRDPDTSIARAVLANANYLTAAICDVTDQKPSAVCGSAIIRALARPK
jgi:hypothetical protein